MTHEHDFPTGARIGSTTYCEVCNVLYVCQDGRRWVVASLIPDVIQIRQATFRFKKGLLDRIKDKLAG